MLVTIIICTRDRADDLSLTLQSMGNVAVPGGYACELLVVDNASRDHTPQVIADTTLPNMTIRTYHEPKPGQSNARNSGLAHAHGEIVIFTDDDLRFPKNWIEKMIDPLVNNQAQAVAGGVRLAPHLERAWMTQVHRYWLAENYPKPGVADYLIGANMAFRREVLERVPAFDPELGPGAFGFGDDTLFGFQLAEAGYRLVGVDATVEHHLLASRLTRKNFLSHAKKLGMSGAYHDYHWEHTVIHLPRMRLVKKAMDLFLWRRTHPQAVSQTEGMDEAEMGHLRSFHLYGQYLIERTRPHNYERHGLLKAGSERAADSKTIAPRR